MGSDVGVRGRPTRWRSRVSQTSRETFRLNGQTSALRNRRDPETKGGKEDKDEEEKGRRVRSGWSGIPVVG